MEEWVNNTTIPSLVYPVCGYKVLRTEGGKTFAANGITLLPGVNKARCKYCQDPRERARKRNQWEPYLRDKNAKTPRFWIPPKDGGMPPVHDHMCGLHSWYTLEAAVNYAVTGFIGVVISWGRVLFDEEFMRAEYQQIMALSEVADKGYGWPRSKTFAGRQYLTKMAVLAKAAEHYDIPILPPEELEDYILQYGIPYQE